MQTIIIILRAMTQLQFRGHRGTMAADRILLHGTSWLGNGSTSMRPPGDRPQMRSPSFRQRQLLRIRPLAKSTKVFWPLLNPSEFETRRT